MVHLGMRWLWLLPFAASLTGHRRRIIPHGR